MSESRKDDLYVILFDVLNELSEHDTPDNIFDSIVDNFATEAEYHMGQANTFTDMLNTFRHNNPLETIPETLEEEVSLSNLEDIDLFGGVSDINRQYLLEDRDNLMDFLKNVHFPDRLNP